MTHIDDPERVTFYREVLQTSRPPQLASFDERHRRLVTMLAWDLGSGASQQPSVDAFFESVWPEGALRDELLELFDLLDARSSVRARPSSLRPEIPLVVHARYTRPEIVAALGLRSGVKPMSPQAGLIWAPQANSDVFFGDLQKAERDYSPTTMYRDYAITRELFHWESQTRQHTGLQTVRRWIEHAKRGTNILLFVREKKTFELGTRPFAFLGPVSYVEHGSKRPVAFTWRLPLPMPEELFEVARSVAAA